MQSRFILISFFILGISFCQGQTSPRKKMNIDDDWKFHFGHSADPTKDFNYSLVTIFSKTGAARGTAIDPRFNDSGWRNLDLPHDWAVELPFVQVNNFDVMSHGYKPVGGLFPETTIGWYRKHFTISKKDSGRRFQIQFDGVFRNANFWINGFYLGNNLSGYIGVDYDITDYLNYDKENVLVARVDATQYEGWFYEGAGIYRHVWLTQYNNLHIPANGIFAYSNIRGGKANISIEAIIENKNLINSIGSIFSYIADRDGKRIAQSKEQTVSLKTNESGFVNQNIVIPNTHLWSIEDPYLYRIISIVKHNGKIIDSINQRFGIRNIEIKPNGVFLNRNYIKIKGTNNHQDHAGVGSALPDYLQYYRVRLLKDLGCNAIRTSHNPPTPELLDACDSLGMLVLDENRLLNSSPENMSQLERLIKRDRNRASVFMWSIGNEEGWVHTTPIGKNIALSL